MSKDEFEKSYAKQHNITVEGLYQLGLFGELCNCNEADCEGWKISWRSGKECLNKRYKKVEC